MMGSYNYAISIDSAKGAKNTPESVSKNKIRHVRGLKLDVQPTIRSLNIKNAQSMSGRASSKISALDFLVKSSDAAGGYVKLEEEFKHCPVMVGSDGDYVFLYEFVEVFDEVVDYREIQRLLPNLSFSQISSAISLLRNIAQFNSGGVDIDECLDEEFEQSEEFLEELKASLKDQEVARVLNAD
jgi:hypothetical protein